MSEVDCVRPAMESRLNSTTSTSPLRSGPVPAAGATSAQTESNLFREVACHSTLVIAGWSDASSGPLIPYIQRYYGISYTVVSMLFIGQMVGFITAGVANGHLVRRYGLGKVIAWGAGVQLLGYAFLVPAFPFPVMPCFGIALQDAAANTFVATLPNAEFKFGILHASYGLGALVCPLASTAFASAGIKFSYFYCISIGLSMINLGIVLGAFKLNFRVEEVDAPVELVPTAGAQVAEEQAESEVVRETTAKATGLLRQTFSTPTMWIFALFIFLYVGAEVSMGGWIVTFVIDERGGAPSAGYVATGFWAGLTVGRIVLLKLNAWVGERRIVPFYLGIAASLELAVWFSRSLVGNAITVALIGILIAPLYPIVMSLATKLLPRHLHASSIGFIAAIGQTGSAVFPFTTGALAQRFSSAALQPVMISLFVGMTGIWCFVPAVKRRVD